MTSATGTPRNARRADARVADAMHHGVCACASETPLREVARGADAPLIEAARCLVAAGVSHPLVLTSASGRPAGVLSTLDIAGAAGGDPERRPS